VTGRERVLMALNHQEPDRVPRTIWVDGGEIMDRVVGRFGSYAAFLDELDTDQFQAFPGPPGMVDWEAWSAEHEPNRRGPGLSQGAMSIDDALEAPFTDPSAPSIYEPIKEAIEFHQRQKGRAIWVQTPGCFETANGIIGMENQLMEMALQPDKMQALYRRQVEWSKVYIETCLALGVDVIHISDDLGENGRMLFSPSVFRSVVSPAMARGGGVRARAEPLPVPTLLRVLR